MPGKKLATPLGPSPMIPEIDKLSKAELKRVAWALGFYATYYRRQFLDIREYLQDILPILLDYSRLPDIIGERTGQEQDGEASPDGSRDTSVQE